MLLPAQRPALPARSAAAAAAAGTAASAHAALPTAPAPSRRRSPFPPRLAHFGPAHATRRGRPRGGEEAAPQAEGVAPAVPGAASPAGAGAAASRRAPQPPQPPQPAPQQQQQQQQQQRTRRQRAAPQSQPQAQAAQPPPAGTAAAAPPPAPAPAAGRRQPFGPEPPPPPLGRTAPSPPPSTSTAAPAVVSAAAAAAAVAASTSAALVTSSVAAAGAPARQPFGPEPPPPPPLPPAEESAPGGLDAPQLPLDPNELSVEDILNLPLPDASLGQPLRRSGAASRRRRGPAADDGADSTGGASGGEGGASAGVYGSELGDGFGEEDDDDDVDYDKLIALASRVDAAAYVERAFERAARGEPPLSPAAAAAAAAADGGDGALDLEDILTLDAEVPPPPPPPQSASAAAASSSSGGLGAAAAAAAAPSAPAAPGPGRASASAPALGGASSAVYVDDLYGTTAASSCSSSTSGGGDGGEPRSTVVHRGTGRAPRAPPPSPAPSAALAPAAAAGAEPGAGGEGEVEDEAAAMQRRMGVLVQLLAASGAELESKLEAIAPEVDEPMLRLLAGRYATAVRLGQDAATTARIGDLYGALKYMYERRTSSPAERLLDDVLDILADTAAAPDPDRRRQDAAARMRSAFTGGVMEVDIFAAAAALAGGRRSEAEALAAEGEMVDVGSFREAALGLLQHARRVQGDTAAAVEEVLAAAAALREEAPGEVEGDEWRARLEQVRLAQQALEDRAGAIEALEEAVMLARAVEQQLMGGGGR